MALVVTPNLKLNVPEFDQIPWDEDVNTNWMVLDATVGMFSAIPNLRGMWKNSTEYLYGQSAIDPLDSSIWTCVQFHTSSALPTTFDQERILYPARWSMTSPGAQFYAEQAAASAADAAASAAAAAESAADIGGGALLKSGGTMTGPLILAADPSALLGAATKQYVDARVGGSGFLPLTGGTMTGTLFVPNIVYTGPAEIHSFAFGWNAGAVSVIVDGGSIGNIATQAYVSDAFLPLTGGSLSGNLYVAGEIQTASIYRLTSSGSYWYSTTGETLFQMDNGGWLLRYARSTGGLSYYRPDGVTLFSISGVGAVEVYAGLNANGNLLTRSGYIYARGGGLYWGAADRSRLLSDNSTFTDIAMLDQYRWNFNWSNGSLAWFRYDNTPLFILDVAGNANFARDVKAGNFVTAMSGTMMMQGNANDHVLQMNTNSYWTYSLSTANLTWVKASTSFLAIRSEDSIVLNALGNMAGHGPYLDYSDDRGKTEVEPFTHGIDLIKQLKPIKFKRILNGRHDIGFSALDTQRVIPEAVNVVGIELPDGSGGLHDAHPTLGISTTPIVAAMVVAMTEFEQRLSALEAGSGTTTN